MRNTFNAKGFTILLLSAVCVFTLWSGISLAGPTGIDDSLHDLSYWNYTGNNPFLYRTKQSCVFCHTPHGAESTVTGGGTWDKASGNYTTSGSNFLLWNRGLANITNADPGYLLYQSSSMDATVDRVRIYSLLCMSCHDGVSALNVVTNYPGDVVQYVGPNGPIPPKDGSVPTTFSAVFDGGASGWGPNIGERTSDTQSVNLSNDHPISFDYDSSLVSADNGLQNPSTVLATTPLRLFPVGATPDVSLECSTCHDVHNEGDPNPYDSSTNPDGETYPFLRMTISQSLMCRACHLK